MTAAAIMELRHAEPDQLLTKEEVAKLLGISVRTFYRIGWFRTRKVRPTESAARHASVRYRRGDVALYQSLRGGRGEALTSSIRRIR